MRNILYQKVKFYKKLLTKLPFGVIIKSSKDNKTKIKKGIDTMKWNIGIRDDVEYPNIEADTKEEAVEIALDWWAERMPQILWVDKEEEERN